MRQTLFIIPGLGFKVHGFSMMLLLACYGALFLTVWRARRERIKTETVYDLGLWLIGGGFVGARAFYLLQYHQTVHQVWDIFKFWQGGIVFYGCIIGGLIGSVIYWLRRPFPFLAMADAVAPSLAIGVSLGRLGCFFNGCCYGDPTGLPWAVRFPAKTLPWARHVHDGLIPSSSAYSLPVHPTQLYSFLAGLAVLGLLTIYYPRRRRDGEVMALLMIAYPITRFLIEILRGDEAPIVAGLTISQTISALLLPCGLVFWSYLSCQPSKRYADQVAEPARPDLVIAPAR